MRGQRCLHPGELEHGCGNGIASLPQAGQFPRLSVKSGEIGCVIEMCVVGDHVHWSGSRKGLLLTARLTIGRLDSTGGISIAGRCVPFQWMPRSILRWRPGCAGLLTIAPPG